MVQTASREGCNCGRSCDARGGPLMQIRLGRAAYPHRSSRPDRQWYINGPTIPMGHHEYRALSEMLLEVAHRYGKPMFIAETGSEGSGGAAWLHYVCDEVRAAIGLGAPIEGICLYPITAYPG